MHTFAHGMLPECTSQVRWWNCAVNGANRICKYALKWWWCVNVCRMQFVLLHINRHLAVNWISTWGTRVLQCQKRHEGAEVGCRHSEPYQAFVGVRNMGAWSMWCRLGLKFWHRKYLWIVCGKLRCGMFRNVQRTLLKIDLLLKTNTNTQKIIYIKHALTKWDTYIKRL